MDAAPVIESGSNYEIQGEGAGAEALGFLKERPGAFRKLSRKRNDAGGVSPSMKERFGGVARAAKAKTQTVELPSACTCRNATFAWGLRYGG